MCSSILHQRLTLIIIKFYQWWCRLLTFRLVGLGKEKGAGQGRGHYVISMGYDYYSSAGPNGPYRTKMYIEEGSKGRTVISVETLDPIHCSNL